MTGIRVKMIADTRDREGNRISTMQLRYQRFFHAELMTHRVFSRNASSSRAIPVSLILESVLNDVALPTYWGENKAGMQASRESNNLVKLNLEDVLNNTVLDLINEDKALALSLLKVDIDTNNISDLESIELNPEEAWKLSAKIACQVAKAFSEAGYHKQIVNRITEPYQYINTIVTSTEWDNFFNLRLHPDAQPEFEELASRMRIELMKSNPRILESTDDYHHPYVSIDEFNDIGNVRNALMVSAARCARVSYLNHDGSNADIKKDLALADMLYKSQHLSPFEHQAQILNISQDQSTDIKELNYLRYRGLTHINLDGSLWSGNLKEFGQFRNFIHCI